MLKYIQTIIQHYGLFKKSLHQRIGNKILHQIGSEVAIYATITVIMNPITASNVTDYISYICLKKKIIHDIYKFRI